MNHPRLSLVGLATASVVAATATAGPAPTTQACLGDWDRFLTCPAGARRWGTECREIAPRHGEGPGEHWSGSKRQGPAIFLRDDDETDPAKLRVSFAALYKDHEKTGRVFHFDDNGLLESWTDVVTDEYHGLSVTCLPDGRVSSTAYYKHDQLVGVSRAWRAKDGALSYSIEHDASGTSRSLEPTRALTRRPDELCRPVRCDVGANPDLSGIPK